MLQSSLTQCVFSQDFFCLAIKDSGWRPCPQEYNNVPKDSLHIGANVGEVIVAARFGPHLGEYMFHCHNGVHEDHEMMRAFMVGSACFSACA
jgi:FtsP/CotA-like multicopper oxidase with cupredoxin domain